MKKKKEGKNIIALVLIVVCTIFTSLGQIFWKKGADVIVLGPELLTNWSLILGFVFYGIGLVLLVKALKFGDLSFVYPFIALSFVWVGLLSYFFMGEELSFLKWIAIIVIVLGVGTISYGGNKNGR